MEPGSVKGVEFKAALRRMVDESGVPHKRFADMLGVAYSTFQAYLDPSTDLHMPSYRLATAIGIARPSTALTSYLASINGAVVVLLPQPGESDPCHLGEVLQAMGTFIRTHATATADGRWTRDEIAQLKAIEQQLHTCVAAQVLHAERQLDAVPFPARVSARG